MEIIPVGPGFGAELRGVTLSDVVNDDAAYAAVRAAFEEHSVLVFRRQEVTDDLQLAFSRRFGPPEVTKVGSMGTGSHFVILSTIGPDGKVVPADHRQAMRAKANQLLAHRFLLQARAGADLDPVSTHHSGAWRRDRIRLDAACLRAARRRHAKETGKLVCLAQLCAFTRPDRAGARHEGGTGGAAAGVLAHGMEKPGQWP